MPGEAPLGPALFCSWELGDQLAKFPAVHFTLLFKIRDDKGHNYKTQIGSVSVGRHKEGPFDCSGSQCKHFHLGHYEAMVKGHITVLLFEGRRGLPQPICISG